MDPSVLGALMVLALIDSTSFGTLLIPVWLLMSPGRMRLGRIAVFLSVVVGAYFVIGLALMFGAVALFNAYEDLLDTEQFLIGQLVLGIGLLIISQLMDTKNARARAAERAASGDGRLMRWRTQILGDGSTTSGSTAAIVVLALSAVAVEVATMLPYLAAIGIISAQGAGWFISSLMLVGYCLFMITPAAVLTAGRIAARSALERPLTRLDDWLTRNAQATTAWVIGIVGFILAARAIFDLGWVGG